MAGIVYLVVLIEMFGLMTVNSFQSHISILDYLRYSAESYFPLFAVYLIPYAFRTNTWWKHLFEWKVWFLPLAGIIVLSLAEWQFNPVLYSTTNVLGLSWQWAAIIEWSILFLAQLILYEHAKVDHYVAFALSYFGVAIASHLYELPYFAQSQQLLYQYFAFPFQKLIIPIAFLSVLYILSRRAFKLDRKIVTIGFIGFLAVLPYFFVLSGVAPWTVRLGTFPLFLAFPLALQRKHSDSDSE